jgi:hypothetical protein
VADLELVIRDAGNNDPVDAAARWLDGDEQRALVQQWFDG